jgi:hypothetical protein
MTYRMQAKSSIGVSRIHRLVETKTHSTVEFTTSKLGGRFPNHLSD